MEEKVYNKEDMYIYKGHDVSIFRYYHEMICKLAGINFPMLSIYKENILEKYKTQHILPPRTELELMKKEAEKLIDAINDMSRPSQERYNEYLKWREKRKNEIDKMIEMYTKDVFDLSITNRYYTITNKTTGESVKISLSDIEKANAYIKTLK